MLARRFLWIIAALIMLLLAGAFGYRFFERQLMETALVPSSTFKRVGPDRPDYSTNELWIARPRFAADPSRWLPAGVESPPGPKPAATFFVHPTSFLERNTWNAPVDHADSAARAALFVRSQASALNGVSQVWAPRYRQATFGAFLTSREDAERALDFAYADVALAWEQFVHEVEPGRPLILAAHSQGSLHLARLMRERVAGTPLARRVVAAYVVGWPLSLAADVPAMGLPACQTPDQAGCILSWQSFAEPADPRAVTELYDASVGFNGQPRRRADMLCTNPLTGAPGGAAPATANLGTLLPNAALTEATLETGRVPARCEGGFLLVGRTPEGLPPYVLPGNNLHVFDYALFWANIRADVARRLATYQTR